MSQLSQDAHASVFIADHIAAEGKLHALGVGFTATILQPSGMTPPMAVAALIDFPSKYAGQEVALSIELRDEESGAAVQVPGPTGQMEALRVQQMTRINPATAPPPLYLPPSMPCRIQSVLGFMNGLPLQAGKYYHWRLEIDGQHRKDWRASFYVIGAPPQPIFGGPIGPSSVPNMPPAPTDEPSD